MIDDKYYRAEWGWLEMLEQLGDWGEWEWLDLLKCLETRLSRAKHGSTVMETFTNWNTRSSIVMQIKGVSFEVYSLVGLIHHARSERSGRVPAVSR